MKSRIRQTDQSSHWVKMAQTGHKTLKCKVGGIITHLAFQSEVKLAQWLKLRARIRLTAPPARQRAVSDSRVELDPC